MSDKPLIIQSDFSILLETSSNGADLARAALAPFAELIKSPEYFHTYQITPLSIWNAVAAGVTSGCILNALTEYSKFPVPDNIVKEISDLTERYGLVEIRRDSDGLYLKIFNQNLSNLLLQTKEVSSLLGNKVSEGMFRIPLLNRGTIKQALIALGYPPKDLAGFDSGDKLELNLKTNSGSSDGFHLRDYQKLAVEKFYDSGSSSGGHGVIVLPCGAGKTIVGLGAMATVSEKTLILTSSVTSVRQWKQEILAKTDLNEKHLCEYSRDQKKIAPVTISTYQMLGYRPDSSLDEFPHFQLFKAQKWGLIVYDEVHLLPAPIFRITAELQAKRRLGLTATLIREDGREKDVFALIGPKRYEQPWRNLESCGYIATAVCKEIRVKQSFEQERAYSLAPTRMRFRVASENPEKINIAKRILSERSSKKVLVIGEYISQIEVLAKELKLPLLTGKTKQSERDELFQKFRSGEISGLVLSRVGNFAIDLPDADLMIQVSGKYGSRQEEAQRLGRILRPKKDGHRAEFYSLVSSRTCEEDFARNRQRFLVEQGYHYEIEI